MPIRQICKIFYFRQQLHFCLNVRWSAVNNGIPAKYIYWLETDGACLYAGTFLDGIYRSTDMNAPKMKSQVWKTRLLHHVFLFFPIPLQITFVSHHL
ncbi:MAG: hypothetical protein WBK40_02160 [Bacteroidales bacterium]